MTTQEALKFLDEHCTASVIPFEVKVLCSQALEKQIPRKPIEEQSLMTCSICGCQEIESIDASGIRQYPYCPCCGNAQDWSDNQ